MHESRGLNSSSNFLAMIIFIAIAISLPSDQAKGELKYALAGKKPMGSELVVPQCKPAVCSFQDDENGVFGAGVIVHPSGILITNCHVMANCGNYGFKLTSSQGAALEIDGVLDYNVQEDWAVLKVHLQGGQTAKMPFVKIGDSRKLQDGEACIAIGHPAGLERSVTSGLIQSASQKVPEFPIPLIYHSAPMYGGNSGGG